MQGKIGGYCCEFDASLMEAFGVTNVELGRAFALYLKLINKDGCAKDEAFVVVQGESRSAVIHYMAVVGLEAVSVAIHQQLQQEIDGAGPLPDPSRN